MNATQNTDRYPFLNACKRLQVLKNVFVVGFVGVKVIHNKGEI